MKRKPLFRRLENPVPWEGRYGRIPGKTPVLRTRADGSVEAYWNPWATDEWLTSRAVEEPAILALAEAVNDLKLEKTGNRGGGFLINEFGQVLVPIGPSGERFWVGDMEGCPEFLDPREDGTTFTLDISSTTPLGTPWDRPYIGMKFNLSDDDVIRFRHSVEDMQQMITLQKKSSNLVSALRSVRRFGSIRFIVNLHGIALTKAEPDWQPVYICHLDRSEWFEKEFSPHKFL